METFLSHHWVSTIGALRTSQSKILELIYRRAGVHVTYCIVVRSLAPVSGFVQYVISQSSL